MDGVSGLTFRDRLPGNISGSSVRDRVRVGVGELVLLGRLLAVAKLHRQADDLEERRTGSSTHAEALANRL